MRNYPRNSPQAAARLLSLSLIADGHVCRSEMEALRHQGIEASLGLPPGGLPEVLKTLCEDLSHGSSTGLMSGLDEGSLQALIREVDDPALQQTLLAAVLTATAADGHLADGERHLLEALLHAWPHQAEAGFAQAGRLLA